MVASRSLLLIFLVVLILLVASFWGCGLQERSSTLEQRQRESLDGSNQAAFVQSTKPDPLKIKIPQGEGKEPIEVQSGTPAETKAESKNTQSSDSSAEGKGNDSASFPFFVKALGVGAAVALFMLLGWVALRGSTALKAAWREINDMIASRIRTVQSLKGAATDPTQIAALTAEENRLNGLRAEAASD